VFTTILKKALASKFTKVYCVYHPTNTKGFLMDKDMIKYQLDQLTKAVNQQASAHREAFGNFAALQAIMTALVASVVDQAAHRDQKFDELRSIAKATLGEMGGSLPNQDVRNALDHAERVMKTIFDKAGGV